MNVVDSVCLLCQESRLLAVVSCVSMLSSDDSCDDCVVQAVLRVVVLSWPYQIWTLGASTSTSKPFCEGWWPDLSVSCVF